MLQGTQDQASLLQMGIRKRCETQRRLQLGTCAPGMRRPATVGRTCRCPLPRVSRALTCAVQPHGGAFGGMLLCARLLPPAGGHPQEDARKASIRLSKDSLEATACYSEPRSLHARHPWCWVRGKALQSVRLTDVLIAGVFEL